MSNEINFLKGLWKGLFDREPEYPEIIPYYAALRNGSISISQLITEISLSQEFINARNHMILYKTLRGKWGTIPTLLEQTGQVGLGIGTGVDVAGGAPFRPVKEFVVEFNATGEEFNATGEDSIDYGPYNDVGDDHSNLVSGATIIGMNVTNFISLFERPGDVDYFRVKSQNLADEGILRITLERNIAGAIVESNLGLNDFDISGFQVLHQDGTYSEMVPIQNYYSNPFDVSSYVVFDLNKYKNVDSYIFPISHYGSTLFPSDYYIGGVSLTLQNEAYLDQAEFLTAEDFERLNIVSKVNSFNHAQAINYYTSDFAYTNRYGQIEMHDSASFFHRLFLNKYDQEPNLMQANRGVQLLNDPGFSQVQFLEQFANENNIITVGGYNYTTSDAELAIPNVPIDVVAFAETALIYSALIGRAPGNAEVAQLTLNPYFEVRSIAERAHLIMEMPEYSARYNISTPKVSILGLRNGDVLQDNQIIVVEAFDNGLDGSFDMLMIMQSVL